MGIYQVYPVSTQGGCEKNIITLKPQPGSPLTCHTGNCGFNSNLGAAGCCTSSFSIGDAYSLTGCNFITACYAATDIESCAGSCSFSRRDLLWLVQVSTLLNYYYIFLHRLTYRETQLRSSKSRMCQIHFHGYQLSRAFLFRPACCYRNGSDRCRRRGDDPVES